MTIEEWMLQLLELKVSYGLLGIQRPWKGITTGKISLSLQSRGKIKDAIISLKQKKIQKRIAFLRFLGLRIGIMAKV